jgi:carboxypeptidase Q
MRASLVLILAPLCLAAAPAPDPALRDGAGRLLVAALADDHAWQRLRELCDGIGNRISGSDRLDRALEWARASLQADGQENVRLEPVTVPKWVRGDEALELTAPQRMPLTMLGLGGSVGTPRDGLAAEVVVASDEAGLRNLGAAAKGRIVLLDQPMPAFDEAKALAGYGAVVGMRYQGPDIAAQQGAVAFLMRSLTERSLRTAHTGGTAYEKGGRRIPAAAISPEDAALLHRLYDAGKKPAVRLRMGARDGGTAPSANVVAELRGREKPEEVVVIGGHIDSWDVGQGAHDDGAGVVMAMEALRLLRSLDLHPRRTVRVVLWTNEENGLAGGKAYARAHAGETHVAALESDMGAFHPIGFSVAMKDAARQQKAVERLQALSTLLVPLGATRIDGGDCGADVLPLKALGVPALVLRVDERHYFDFHHSWADTLDKVDPAELARGVASVAILAWALAEMPERLGD